MDEISFPTMGWSGLTLRLYNADRDEWSLYWVSGQAHTIDPPVVGRWDDEGQFVGHCDDVFDDRPIRVRYIWNNVSATTAHWEQAFSEDDGHTWETNWTLNSVRTS